MDEWAGDIEREDSSRTNLSGDSVLEVVQQRVKKLHDSLEALALQLRDDLKASAADLGIGDVPGEDEFQSLVRGTPIFEPRIVDRVGRRPRFSALFGRRLAKKQLANQLRRELGRGSEQDSQQLFGFVEGMGEVSYKSGSSTLRDVCGGLSSAGRAIRSAKTLTTEEAHALQEDLKRSEPPRSIVLPPMPRDEDGRRHISGP